MKLSDIPYSLTDWSKIVPEEHKGTTGTGYSRTRNFGGIDVHMVEYTPGYCADGWCTLGHIVLCLEGELHSQLKDGRTFVLTPGMSYQVGDHTGAHQSSTETGARLFVIDLGPDLFQQS